MSTGSINVLSQAMYSGFVREVFYFSWEQKNIRELIIRISENLIDKTSPSPEEGTGKTVSETNMAC